MTLFFGGSSGDMAADRRFEYALNSAAQGDHTAAADLLAQGIELAPQWPPLYFHLGEALARLKLTEAATKAYTTYLTLDPADHMGAFIRLSLLNETPTPQSMPPSYVESLFDEYADRFDHSLVEKLQYRTPWILRNELDMTFPHRRYNHILDLGCGTGLVGQAMKDTFDCITGIDISARMVEQARRKNLYTNLAVSTIDSYMDGHGHPSFDLIIAADVLVYIGALETLFAQISRALHSGGIVALSVQSLDGDGWKLGQDHRYAHSAAYLNDCAAKAGLTLISHHPINLRKDGPHMIGGLLSLYQKP